MTTDTAPCRRTPLDALHRELGAQMGPFAGYELPIRYKAGIVAEHGAVRQAAGLFDVSHMGQIAVEGADAARAIQRACPLPAAAMRIGACRYGLFLDDNAGILDDFLLSRVAEERYLAVVNAANKEADRKLLEAEAEGLAATVRTLPRAMVAVQGPAARRIVGERIPGAETLSFLSCIELDGDRFLSATGYTGEDGFEIALPADAAVDFVRSLLDCRELRPAGLGARDSLRLEAGLPLHGQDISPDTNPFEAGLGWAVPKGVREAGGFRGDAALAAAARPPLRRRTGLLPLGKMPVRAGAPLSDSDGRRIGAVTSGGFSPTLERPVAMGYADAGRLSEGGRVEAEVRGRRLPCEIAPLPFVPHRYWRSDAK